MAGDVAGELAGLRTAVDRLTQGLQLMLETQATQTEMLRAVPEYGRRRHRPELAGGHPHPDDRRTAATAAAPCAIRSGSFCSEVPT